MSKAKKEKEYRITTKGWLGVQTGMYKNFEPIWDRLIEFVAHRAALDGYPEGVPILILNEGGICMTAQKIEGDSNE